MSYESVFRKALVTRLCHDLAGGVSAVSNCLSLMIEPEVYDKETLELADSSAQMLFARLRFFRAAFGNDGALADIETTKKTLEEYLKTLENKRISYACQWEVDSELSLFMFRLILLSSLVALECLSKGGLFTIISKAGEEKIQIELDEKQTFPTVCLDEIIKQENKVLLEAKNIHIFFLLNCLEEFDWRISFEKSQGKQIILLEKNHR